MIQNVDFFNSLNSLLQVKQKNTYQSANQVNTTSSSNLQRQDSFVITNQSLNLEPYSNQTKEPISREEYEKYCGIATDGKTTIYFPPESASYDTKKAWIEGIKQLEAEGKGGEIACINLGILHYFREKLGLGTDTDLSKIKEVVSGGLYSCQDILMNLLDEAKDQLAKGDNCGVSPEKFRKLQEGHIDALQTVLNSFKKYNAA